MKHLDILHDPSRTGDAVADARARLDTTAFRAAVAATAARFAAAGIGRGDVVATVLTNRVELVVALYAAWDLGAVLTPVNPALTPDEIAYQLTDGGVRLAVVEAATAGKVTVDSIDAATLLEPGDPSRLRGAAAPDDLALLIYTSGTTGRPKGVMLDHANIESMTGMLLAQDIFRRGRQGATDPAAVPRQRDHGQCRRPAERRRIDLHRRALRCPVVLVPGRAGAAGLLLRRASHLPLPHQPARRRPPRRLLTTAGVLWRRPDARRRHQSVREPLRDPRPRGLRPVGVHGCADLQPERRPPSRHGRQAARRARGPRRRHRRHASCPSGTTAR